MSFEVLALAQNRRAHALLYGFSMGVLGGLAYWLAQMGDNRLAVAAALGVLANYVAVYAWGCLP